jgi:putative FmdB family regulatory protein
MPLYEYKCDRCSDVFEVIQKFSDAPLERHEGCGGQVERLISPSALQFKGTGWYVTDYARGSNGKDESKSKSAASDKSSKAGKDSNGSKSEAKPSSPATAEKK